MSTHNRSGGVGDGVPPTNRSLLVVAAILLLIPIIALLWVSSYARETPRLGGVPFFFWYQFLWVFICSAMTYAAHRLVLAARKPSTGTTDAGPRAGEERDGHEGGTR